MAPVSCHLPAREHMARDTLVWWKQIQQCQFTSDQQAKVQTLMKTLSHKAENGKNVMWWQMCILQACWKFHMTFFSKYTLKNKGSNKKGFSQWCHGKNIFCGSPKNFSVKHSKKNHFSYYKEHFNLKNLLWNGKVPWMLKVLHGTINANNELLFLLAYGNA